MIHEYTNSLLVNYDSVELRNIVIARALQKRSRATCKAGANFFVLTKENISVVVQRRDVKDHILANKSSEAN